MPAAPAASVPHAVSPATPHTMQCMEVWGGNSAVDQGVTMPGLEVWVVSEPVHGNDMGGDVHYVSSCGTGRIVRVVVADVSGHGAAVAATARSLRTLMRRFVNYLDQTRFVAELNHGFLRRDEDDGRFATSVALTYFAPTRRLQVCNAGHPRPLRWRAREGRWSVLDGAGDASTAEGSRDPTNLPLGVLGPTRYRQFDLGLEPGDLVLSFTDAIVEARSPAGEMLGEEGLLRLLRELDPRRPEALLPALRAALASWRGGAEADDDLTLLLLRCHDGPVQAPLHARLGASLRFLGLLLRAAIPLGERPPIPWPEPSRENILGALAPRRR